MRDDIESSLEAIEYLMDTGKEQPSLPDSARQNPHYQNIVHYVLAFQRFTIALAQGNLNERLDLKGYLAGAIKSLQASMRHLSWQTRMVASGDFSQRVDFMGEFADAFNSMVSALYRNHLDITKREADLLTANSRLETEIIKRETIELALRESESRYRLLAENSEDVIWTMNMDGRFTYVSPSIMQLRGFTPEEVINQTVNEAVCPGSQDIVVNGMKGPANLLDANGRQTCRYFEIEQPRKDGSTVWTEATVRVVQDANGQAIGLVGVSRDISARREAQAALHSNERRYRSLWESANEGFCLSEIITDPSGKAIDYRILDCNPAYESMTGFASGQIEGALGSEVFAQLPPPNLDIFAEVATGGTSRKFASDMGSKDTYFDISESAGDQHRPYTGAIRREDKYFDISVFSPSPGRFAIALFDTSERKTHEDKLHYIARHDSLTGLPNRFYFNETLSDLLDTRRRNDQSLAILFIDLDRFKFVNDTLGHHVGDALLIQTGQRLQACLREGDTLCRMGGDEFTIIARGITEKKGIERVASRILKALCREFRVMDHDLNIGASIGVAICPNHASTPSELLKKADTAMYRAKELGKNNCQIYSPEMDAHNLEKLKLDREIRQALKRNHLEVFYQARVDPIDGQLMSAEALLRWRHPERGLIGAGEFIAVAEESDLILQLGYFVLRSVCKQQKAWKDQGIEIVPIALNLCGKHINRAGFLDEIERYMDKYDLNADTLVLEAPGAALLDAGPEALESIGRLRKAGTRIVLDDFGEGAVSLVKLSSVPVDCLKINFGISSMSIDSEDTRVAIAVSATARNMGLELLAVGIETREHLEFIGSLMCDSAQGYLFGYPQTADDFTQLLRSGKVEPGDLQEAA